MCYCRLVLFMSLLLAAYKAFVVSATGAAQLRITGDYKTDEPFSYIIGRALTVPAGCQCDLLVPKGIVAHCMLSIIRF